MKSQVLALLFILGMTSFTAAQKDEAPKAIGSNFNHLPGTKLKSDRDTLAVHRMGSGEIPVIMITGHMQGADLYKNFIERNSDKASYHVAVPPGMAGTPAYPWPEKAEEFLSRPWSSQFEEELVAYMDEHLTEKPVLVANWYSGLGMSLHIADKHPGKLRGLILVGPAGRSPYYRWYRPDSTNADMLFDAGAQQQRIENFIGFWRTVDEFTWHSNMFPPGFYSTDQLTGVRVVYKESKGPVPIGMRYFLEYVIDDLTQEVRNLEVPPVAIATLPDRETVKARMRGNQDIDQLYKRLKSNVKRDWQTEENEYITVKFVENSGLMAWEDKAQEFDRIFSTFISNQ